MSMHRGPVADVVKALACHARVAPARIRVPAGTATKRAPCTEGAPIVHQALKSKRLSGRPADQC